MRVDVNFPVEMRRNTSLTSITFLFLVVCNSLNWPNIKIWGLGAREFLDLEATMNFVDCYEKFGSQIYSVPNGVNCSNYVYGFLLVAVGDLFGINHIPTRILGFISLAILAYVIAYFLSALKVKYVLTLVIMLVLVLSPPVSLLAQRANIDILIAFLTILGFHAIRHKFNVIGFFLITLTVFIKFYTLLLLFLLLFQKPFRKPIYFLLTLVIVISTVVNFSLIKSLPSDGVYAAFGNRSIYYYLQDAQLLQANAPNILGDLSGLILVITVVVALLAVDSRFKNIFSGLNVDKSLGAPNAFLYIGLSCYMLGMSYDYRLVYFLLPMLLFQTRIVVLDGIFKYFFIIAVAYTSFNGMYFVQLVGDILIGLLTSFLLFLFVRSFLGLPGSRE
jgi:hypothetical protein